MSVVVEDVTQTVVIEEDTGISTVSIVDEVVSILEVGIQGPPGKDGADGAAGTSDKTFSQSFFNTASVSVTHDLGKFPSVTVIDSANDEVEGMVRYLDLNNLTISFSAPFSGTVTLN